MDIGVVIHCVHVVFALQALRHHFELQLAYRPQQQRVARARIKHLNRTLFAEFLQALLQLLGLKRIARTADAEHLRGKVRNALEAQLFTFGQGVTDLQLTMIVDADDVTGHRILAAHAFVRHKGQRVGELHFTSGAHVHDLHPRRIAP